VELETLNLVDRLIVASASPQMANHPFRKRITSAGRSQSHTF